MRHKIQPSPALFLSGLVLLSVALLRCTSPEIRVQDEAMRYDFYGTDKGIRIMGRGSMPTGALSDSYEDRKARCMEAARMHANSKWLGLTEQTMESQNLWYHRLMKGARGPWQRCFDEATMLRYIPGGDSCTVVMLYRCDPRDW